MKFQNVMELLDNLLVKVGVKQDTRGIKDKRGQLFFDFIRILEAKQPKFFLLKM